MNRLPIEKRAQIVGLLVEGMSMRAVTRLTGVSINTVMKLLEDVGLACGLYQAQVMVNLRCERVQCDEIWAFCYAKEKNVKPARKGELGFGDVYTWTAIDADTKLIASYMVGKRDTDYAEAFIGDLAHRRRLKLFHAGQVNRSPPSGAPSFLRIVAFRSRRRLHA